MPGEKTRAAIHAQPDWLAQVPTDRRLPEGKTVFTGCGTSYHVALTGGHALQALEAVLAPPDADVLVLVSHEGGTAVTLDAARAFDGPRWLVTGKADGPIAELCDEVIVATPAIEESYCHTASYTCGAAAIAALLGEDVSGFPVAVADVLAGERWAVSEHERWLVAGAGRDRSTAQEAILKLREAARVAGEYHETEQLLHGHLAAVDDSVRCFVLEGRGRAAERAHGLVAALGELGCDVTLVPSVHPVIDIVRFQLLALDLADARGVDADMIRWDEEPWKRARDAYA
jgi:fructoselysine-6-P-deglycase FrlB-like protein